MPASDLCHRARPARTPGCLARSPPARAGAATSASSRSRGCARRARARRRLRADRPARARARPRHHRRGPRRASRLPRAVRARRRGRRAAVRRRRVRPRVLLERDRARPAGAPRGVRRGDPPRGPGLVRADARLLVPDRAALAAAGRPLAAPRCAGATGAWAPPASWEEISLLAGAEMEALFGPALGPSASGRSSRAGCACSPARNATSAAETADVVAHAVDHEEQQQHDPHRAEAVHGRQRDPPSRAASRPPTTARARRRAAGTGTG